MKNILHIFLISLFSLTIISCASSSDDSASTSSDNTTTSSSDDDSSTTSTTTDDNSTSTDNTTTDTTAPVISEVTVVTNPTNDSTPDYTFSSSEAGKITYGGSCSSSITSATFGNNTITLVSLSEGTYENCTIKVTDSSGNVSNSLTITSFIVDTTAASLVEVTAVTNPTNDTTPDYTFSSSEAGTITYGGSCSSSTTSATSDNNNITLVSLSDGTYSNCTITVTDSAGNASGSLTMNSFVVDTTSPTVSSTSPSDSASSVSIGSTISVTFSESIDKSSVTANTSNTTCSESMQLSSNNFSSCIQMSSTPSASNTNKTFSVATSDNLSSETTYKTRITTGVKDLAGNALGSTYTTSSGFTTADITAPTLSQVTAVSTPTNDNTSSYTFSSTEAGTITYGGSCSSDNTSATTDNNTVTFNALADGTYDNCTITVTDNVSNSATLNVSSFEIDNTNSLYLYGSKELRCGGDGFFTYSSNQNQITFGNPPQILNQEDNSSISSGSSINLSESQYSFNILNGSGSRFYITVSPQTAKVFIQYEPIGNSNSCLSQ